MYSICRRDEIAKIAFIFDLDIYENESQIMKKQATRVGANKSI